jgi:hypothetical protein
MNDKELDELLSELANQYDEEFDLEGGLARLRAAGHGLSDRRSTAGNEGSPAIAATAGRLKVSAAAGRTDMDQAIAVLEGVLVSEDVVQVDLTKLEGAPSHHALVVFDRRPTAPAPTATGAAREWSTLGQALTSPLWLATIAGTFAALVVTLIALALNVTGYGVFSTAVATLLGVMYRGSQVMIAHPKPRSSRRAGRKGNVKR